MDGQHVCKIDKGGFAKAAALVMGGVYIVCGIVVALWPDVAIKLFGYLTHLVNLGEASITFVGFIIGLVEVLVYTYAIAWLVAWLHNKFCRTA